METQSVNFLIGFTSVKLVFSYKFPLNGKVQNFVYAYGNYNSFYDTEFLPNFLR